MDKEISNQLIDAVQQAKAHSEEWRKRREKKLWNKVNFPCTLSEALKGLTKDELDEIRRNLDLRGLSSLKKADLIEKLVELIPQTLNKQLYLIDQQRYDLLRAISIRGHVKGTSYAIDKIKSLMSHSLVFPSKIEGEKVLIMPEEILAGFRKEDGDKLQNQVKANTEYIKLTHGMFYYYGILDGFREFSMVEKYMGVKLDIKQYYDVIHAAMDYYEKISYTEKGFVDYKVFDASALAQEQRKRENIDYYPFTKEQLLKAGEENFVEYNREMRQFIAFLKDHYHLSKEEIHEIVQQFEDMIRMDMSLDVMFQYYQSQFEISSEEHLQRITNQLVHLNNNGRKWVLKGHTPDELRSQHEKRTTLENHSNVIPFRRNSKVGRNEPCPCGSGKKYKKCCGR